MNWKMLVCCAAVSGLAVSGCKSDTTTTDGGTTQDAGTDGSTSTGMTYTYVVSALDVGNADTTGTYSPGFNLDGNANAVCGQSNVDYSAPTTFTAPYDTTGIDNDLGPTLAGLLMTAGNGGTSADLFTSNINNGKLLLLVEVKGVDSLTNDSAVAVNIYLGQLAGGAMPMLTNGMLTPGQSIPVEAASLLSDGTAKIKFATASITNGVLITGAANFPLSIPVGGANLSVTLQGAKVGFGISATTITNGVVGGTLLIADIIAAINVLQASDSGVLPSGISASEVMGILTPLADMNPDGNGMNCTGISLSLTMSGVTATATGTL